MNTWIIQVSQNNWEYIGQFYIRAKKVEKVGRLAIKVDGVIIKFDEEVREPIMDNTFNAAFEDLDEV